MPLSIRNARVEARARELALREGRTMTETIDEALGAALERQDERALSLRIALRELAAECASLPELDARSADEILGYGSEGAT